ncbi:pyridoxal phosphate-dependent aminotransferase [Bacillus manliponensis]|uniref:Pyridoxal phosphate-dependent aminotransferase n=2 Tax=Bacillus manliponensis TaxID=574376 RepID=A0A073KD98_9BACI|nr:aminotransferase class I/II-fold pyridoxal phosphate-dependent enzyme [Bacillus manliponensis]KEK20293.1 pyridoxal phosphate-dependent aminotransferase [Bacillus manliponensis]
MEMIKNKQRIYLSSPHMSGNEQKYIQDAFHTNWIAPLGPNVDAFEKELASFVGAGGGAAVSSGTAAIHLALQLLDVRRGDKVFCSSFTFVASANPILYLGAEPVFIDSELETWNMSPQALEKALVDATREGGLPKAVIVVHLYGQSAKMDEIISLCDEYGVPIIEDAAESLGSTYKGKASGTFGRFGVYSFNGNKIITTSGGGMLVSNDIEALERARFFATQAKDPAPYYEHSSIGYNYRMSNILAGIGRGQLEVLEERIKVRRDIFQRYAKQLSDIGGFHFIRELENTYSNRWLTTLTIEEEGVSAKDVLRALEQENIEARPVWKPLHLQPLFRESKYYSHSEGEDVCSELFKKGICLPSGSNMTVEDQERVIQCIQNIL